MDQLEHIIGEIDARTLEIDEIDAHCSKTIKEMDAVKDKLATIATGVFSEFTARTGVAYHDESAALVSKAISDCRNEFAVLISKMRSQHSYLIHSIEKCEQELVALSEHIKESEAAKMAEEQVCQVLQSKANDSKSTLATLQAAVDQARSRLAEVDTDTLLKELRAAGAQQQAASKEVAMAEVEIEKALREREAVLKRCAVEQIYLPLLRGSLSDDQNYQVRVVYCWCWYDL
jgi:chromosome segregation ATPase